jgi:hypothetical protein
LHSRAAFTERPPYHSFGDFAASKRCRRYPGTKSAKESALESLRPLRIVWLRTDKRRGIDNFKGLTRARENIFSGSNLSSVDHGAIATTPSWQRLIGTRFGVSEKTNQLIVGPQARHRRFCAKHTANAFYQMHEFSFLLNQFVVSTQASHNKK